MLVGIEADSVMGNRNFCKKNFPWLYLEFFFFFVEGLLPIIVVSFLDR